MVQQMIELGLLATLDHAQLTGLDDLREPWQNPTYDPNNAHSIPLSWGTTGLIYDTTKLSPPPPTGPIYGSGKTPSPAGSPYSTTSAKPWGRPWPHWAIPTTRPTLGSLRPRFKRLQELKPAIAQFSSFGWEDSLIAGDLDLCMTYSHLGNALPAEHSNLRYVIPTSGSSLWTDAIAILKTLLTQMRPMPGSTLCWSPRMPPLLCRSLALPPQQGSV
jgi:spermidine/putrescine transport system substrate-binding protein